MSTVYNLCVMLIKRGLTSGLKDKIKAYLDAGSITEDEYNKLMDMLEV